MNSNDLFDLPKPEPVKAPRLAITIYELEERVTNHLEAEEFSEITRLLQDYITISETNDPLWTAQLVLKWSTAFLKEMGLDNEDIHQVTKTFEDNLAKIRNQAKTAAQFSSVSDLDPNVTDGDDEAVRLLTGQEKNYISNLAINEKESNKKIRLYLKSILGSKTLTSFEQRETTITDLHSIGLTSDQIGRILAVKVKKVNSILADNNLTPNTIPLSSKNSTRIEIPDKLQKAVKNFIKRYKANVDLDKILRAYLEKKLDDLSIRDGKRYALPAKTAILLLHHADFDPKRIAAVIGSDQKNISNFIESQNLTPHQHQKNFLASLKKPEPISLSDADRKTLAELFSRKKPIDDIRRHLTRTLGDLSPKKHKANPAADAAVLALHALNLSTRQIGKTIGRPENYCRGVIKEKNLTPHVSNPIYRDNASQAAPKGPLPEEQKFPWKSDVHERLSINNTIIVLDFLQRTILETIEREGSFSWTIVSKTYKGDKKSGFKAFNKAAKDLNAAVVGATGIPLLKGDLEKGTVLKPFKPSQPKTP